MGPLDLLKVFFDRLRHPDRKPPVIEALDQRQDEAERRLNEARRRRMDRELNAMRRQ